MLTFKEFIHRFQSKTINHHTRIFAFIGLERFLHNRGIKLIKSINPDISGNPRVFQYGNFDNNSFLNELYSVPFLQQRKFVILNLNPNNPSFNTSIDQTNIDTALEKYLIAPSLFSILIITAENWCLKPKLKTLIKNNNGLLIECAPIPDHQLTHWVTNEIRGQGKAISLTTAQSLIKLTGNNLTAIDEAVQKLILHAGQQPGIEETIVQKLIAEDREYDKKNLVRAVLAHQTHKALSILNQLAARGHESYQLMGYLTGVFKREALPYKTRRKKVKALLETDFKTKAGLMTEDRALQLLIIKLAETN